MTKGDLLAKRNVLVGRKCRPRVHNHMSLEACSNKT